MEEVTGEWQRKGGAAKSRPELINHYEVLNIDARSTRLAIREAYLRLKATYSSGSAALYSLISEDEAEESMAKIEEAFRVLNDDAERREFDRRLGISRDLESSFDPFAQHSLASEMQAERLGHLRENFDGGPFRAGAEARSHPRELPPIKLRASRVGSNEMNEKYQAILSAGEAGEGEVLRGLREAAGVTEEEIQERTKVGIGYIRAFEENHYDRLPQLVYVRGFLRSYLRYLDVPNLEQIVEAYSTKIEAWRDAQAKRS